MLRASSRSLRAATPLSRRAGAYAMVQRRAYTGGLTDKDRIFTNVYAVAANTSRAGEPTSHASPALVPQVQRQRLGD